MIIFDARIYTMEGGCIENGFVEIRNGVFTSVGDMNDCPALTADDIDAGGAYLLPGIVDAHTHIGIWEEGIGLEGDDANESTDPAMPQLRAIDAINTRDPAFQTALEGGVTTVVTGPGSANPIGGQFAAIKTGGSVWLDDRIIKAPVSMKFALGENPKHVFGENDDAPMTRMATAAIIRENLGKALEYYNKLLRAEEDEDYDGPDYDIKLDALLPVIKGELPAHFHAHRADDIATAVRIANEYNLRYAIIHATEAAFISKPLSKLNDNFMGLIIGPILGTRSKPELANLSVNSPALLSKSGIVTALCTDHQVIPENYLMLCAALSVKSGMSETDALAAITINAARTAGIDSRVGSIAPGKDADIVMYDRHPFDIFANVVRVIINGETVYRS